MHSVPSAAAMSSKKPFLVRVLNTLGRRTPLRHWARQRLNVEAMHATACSQLNKSSNERPNTELILLLASLNKSELSFTGALALYEIIMGAIKNNFSLQQVDTRAVKQQCIESPIFIAGFPRTGTTMLHNLINQDECRQAPFMWELHEPALSDKPKEIAALRKAVQRFAKANLYLCPELNDIHPIDADAIEECLKFVENTFVSPTYLMYNQSAEYQQWLLAHLDSDIARGAYQAHRLQLQLLQLNHQRNKQWVLKSPVHALMMEGLVAAYPDALIINTHRDPCQAIPSFCSLTRVIRSMISEDVDLSAIGQLGLAYFDHCLAVTERVVAQNNVTMVDVSYEAMISQPIKSVQSIYTIFGLTVSEGMRKNMGQWLAESQSKRQHNNTHQYTLGDYGLSEALIHKRYEKHYEYLKRLNESDGVLKRS